MIEFCSIRRMIITIVLLGVITGVTVIVEYRIEAKSETEHNEAISENISVTPSTPCYKTANMTEVKKCIQCTPWEKNGEFCKATGFREEVVCDNGSTSKRSCPRPVLEDKRDFFIHFSCWLLAGIISYIFVFTRRNALDKKLMDKVNQQIASGV